MKRALARLSLEWCALLQEVPPEIDDATVSDLRDRLNLLARDTAFCWGVASPVEYNWQDSVLRKKEVVR